MSSYTDQERAKFELARRLRNRTRRANGLPVCGLNGATGKYSIPTRKTVMKGVERRRALRVAVTLPTYNLPELGKD